MGTTHWELNLSAVLFTALPRPVLQAGGGHGAGQSCKDRGLLLCLWAVLWPLSLPHQSRLDTLVPAMFSGQVTLWLKTCIFFQNPGFWHGLMLQSLTGLVLFLQPGESSAQMKVGIQG